MTTINNLTTAATSNVSTDNYIIQTVGNVTKKLARSVLTIFASSEAKILGSSTGKTSLASANTSATDYTATFQAATGTIAYLSDIAGLGTGDMTLAGVQNVTGLKTFDPSKLAMKGSSTGVTTFVTANSSATDYTVTFPAVTGTVALTSSNITGSAATLTTARTIGGVSFNGSADITQPFLIPVFYPGVPANAAIFAVINFTSAVTFTSAFAGSKGRLETNPTATTTIDAKFYNSSNTLQASGTVSIATSGVVTFTLASPYTTAAGDYLKITNQTTADTSAANISFTLLGAR